MYKLLVYVIVWVAGINYVSNAGWKLVIVPSTITASNITATYKLIQYILPKWFCAVVTISIGNFTVVFLRNTLYARTGVQYRTYYIHSYWAKFYYHDTIGVMIISIVL